MANSKDIFGNDIKLHERIVESLIRLGYTSCIPYMYDDMEQNFPL